MRYSPVQCACHKCLLLGATDRIEKQIYFVAIKVFLCHLHSNRHVYAERLKERGWVSRDGRVRGEGDGRGGRSGEEAGSHSFTHNFLETEWGCLHKAKKRMMARKDFVAVHFPTLYREWRGAGGCVGGMSLQIFSWQEKKKKHKVDEEENFEISNHQKFMRHKMRLKTEGVALSLLGGWTADDGGGHRRKIKS